MSTYRAYFFTGHCLVEAGELPASDDLEAIYAATLKAGGRAFELWHGNRKVKEVRIANDGPTPRSPRPMT